MNALMDIWTVFWRDWVVLKRRLTKFILSRMVAPMLYLVAFGWGLGRSIEVSSGTYLDFLVPGILALNSMNISFNSITPVHAERIYHKSLEEYLIAPIWPPAFVIGKVLAAVLRGLISSALIVVLALLFGAHIAFSPLFLAVLVIAALTNPGASIAAVEPVEAYATGTSSFFSSFIEGYGTMDAIAGLAFGIVVVDVIRRMGVDNDDAVAVDVLGSGALTGILMAVIYIVTILMGTQSRGLFEISDNGGIALTQIAGHYFGGVGQIILAVTITFACLKTSIGLVTSCSETFVKMTHGKLSYKAWAILFTLFSFAVSNVGLSAIIEYSIPVLMLIYPPAIALIILAFIGKFFHHDKAVYISVMAFTWAAAIFDFMKTLPAGVQSSLHLDRLVAFARQYLPLFDLNLGWLLPACLGFVIGLVIHFSGRKSR